MALKIAIGHSLRMNLNKSFFQILGEGSEEYCGQVWANFLGSCGRYRSERANELNGKNNTFINYKYYYFTSN
jgi:hypothetical protein